MRGMVVLYVAVMALVTYLIRMLPFTLFRKKITSSFWRSFFFCLLAMSPPGDFEPSPTFPALPTS